MKVERINGCFDKLLWLLSNNTPIYTPSGELIPYPVLAVTAFGKVKQNMDKGYYCVEVKDKKK